MLVSYFAIPHMPVDHKSKSRFVASYTISSTCRGQIEKQSGDSVIAEASAIRFSQYGRATGKLADRSHIRVGQTV
jgi:hypothetical protein